MTTMNSPPILPIHRQPSPLSFSVTSDDASPPPSPGSQHRSIESSLMSSAQLPHPSATESAQAGPSRSTPSPGPKRTQLHRQGSSGGIIPTAPIPDSLLYRSTISHLDGATYTLKRLSKSVLAHSSALVSALEAVERAEVEFMAVLKDLARFLEGGSGASEELWSDDGLRKMRKEKWTQQRDEVKSLVEQGVMAVRGDLKRWGLAGGNAQSKFDRMSKQYYDQTSAYLSHADPASHMTPSHPMSAMASATSSSIQPRRLPSSSMEEAEQAARTASFDLLRYSYHSTLLYAVPPSSMGCLDLLVNLYTWVGGVLGEESSSNPSPERVVSGYNSTPSLIPQTPRARQPASPTRIGLMKDEVANSLSHLADQRVELLDGWAKRNEITQNMGDETSRIQTGGPSRPSTDLASSEPPTMINSTPISSSGVGYRKQGGKIHKIQRSVGGKLRDLLSSSSSTARDLHLLAGGRGGLGDKSARNSFDVSVLSGSRGMPIPEAVEELGRPRMDELERAGSSAPAGMSIKPVNSGFDARPLRSAPLGSSPSAQIVADFRRPSNPSHHSTQFTKHDNAAFLLDPDLFPLEPLPNAELSSSITEQDTTSQQLPPEAPHPRTSSALTASPEHSLVVPLVMQGEDGAEEVGRKREGVLWGAGTWEEVGRKERVKWERYWVVLDRSSIYEKLHTLLSISNLRVCEKAEERIDGLVSFRLRDEWFLTCNVKLTSVVFEIVTASKGRRLYQATSELEMKQWISAICNAIESVIQGISSVRTFDTSALRTLSGAYDDHALPIRHKLGFPVPGIPPKSNGLNGFGAYGGMGNPGRRSMPPPTRGRSDDGHGKTYGLIAVGGSTGTEHRPWLPETRSSGSPIPMEEKRSRKTSFRQALKQSAEMAGGRLRDVVGPSYARSQGNSGSPSPFLAPVTAGMDRGHSPSSYSAASSISAHAPKDGSRSSASTPSPESRMTDRQGRVSGDAEREGDDSVGSWYGVGADGDIEKRVLEMVGLGLGSSPSQKADGAGATAAERRVRSEGRDQLKPSASGSRLNQQQAGLAVPGGGREMSRSRSAEVPHPSSSSDVISERTKMSGKPGETMTMEVLRRVAGYPGNSVCADCGKSTKSSRWASISLRETPIVIFLCIRCCGVHRSFGTHISKPRSVDLDIWTADSIASAVEWGNIKGNEVWEAVMEASQKPARDEDVPEFIRKKYVDGQWLSKEWRARYGLEPR